MEKDEESYSVAPIPTPNFTALDYSLDHLHLMKPPAGETSGNDNNDGTMVDYMLHNPKHHHHHQQVSNENYSFEKLSFADVMQFADFGPKLALNQSKISQEYQETGMIDPVYFLKFPVLNDKLSPEEDGDREADLAVQDRGGRDRDEDQARVSDSTSVQLRFVGDDAQKNSAVNTGEGGKNKRKRPRSIKTSEEVESQRMTHIAVERNRRKQMNEHLRVLRSLMPGSYVQRGDQASIIGGAIEFVRELEQLLQCLESQKRRRLYGEASPTVRQIEDANNNNLAIQQPPILFPPLGLPNDHQIMKVVDGLDHDQTGLQEETAENKSCLADVEVKLLGFDAIIKILCRRRAGQLVKTIAALEDLQLNILHTNITTIEQTVLYSFNVKVGSEMRFTAEDIASSVQQIFSFIHANSNM